MRKLNPILALQLFCAVGALALMETGCGAGRLQQGGGYAPGVTTYATNADNTVTTNFVASAAPDIALFKIDSAFDLAYSVVNTAFELEKKNRALLEGVDINIKHTLDQLRPGAAEAVIRYGKARRIYLMSPTPAGLSELQTVLSQIQNAAIAAQSALPK